MKLIPRPKSAEVASIKKIGTVIKIPQSPSEIATTCTVILKTNGQVEVMGPVHQPTLCVELLKRGMARVIAYADQERHRSDAAKAMIQPAQCIPPGLKPLGEAS